MSSFPHLRAFLLALACVAFPSAHALTARVSLRSKRDVVVSFARFDHKVSDAVTSNTLQFHDAVARSGSSSPNFAPVGSRVLRGHDLLAQAQIEGTTLVLTFHRPFSPEQSLSSLVVSLSLPDTLAWNVQMTGDLETTPGAPVGQYVWEKLQCIISPSDDEAAADIRCVGPLLCGPKALFGSRNELALYLDVSAPQAKLPVAVPDVSGSFFRGPGPAISSARVSSDGALVFSFDADLDVDQVFGGEESVRVALPSGMSWRDVGSTHGQVRFGSMHGGAPGALVGEVRKEFSHHRAVDSLACEILPSSATVATLTCSGAMPIIDGTLTQKNLFLFEGMLTPVSTPTVASGTGTFSSVLNVQVDPAGNLAIFFSGEVPPGTLFSPDADVLTVSLSGGGGAAWEQVGTTGGVFVGVPPAGEEEEEANKRNSVGEQVGTVAISEAQSTLESSAPDQVTLSVRGVLPESFIGFKSLFLLSFEGLLVTSESSDAPATATGTFFSGGPNIASATAKSNLVLEFDMTGAPAPGQFFSGTEVEVTLPAGFTVALGASGLIKLGEEDIKKRSSTGLTVGTWALSSTSAAVFPAE